MALSINPATFVITVPQADLTLVSGTLYKYDIDTFRLALKALEDDPDYMPFPKTHLHNTEVTVAGITFARTVEILPPYSVEFENGSYSVRLEGANNNVFDVEGGILVQNTVQVIPTNSAGLIAPITPTQAGYLDASISSRAQPGDAMDLVLDAVDATAVATSGVEEVADQVWDEARSEHAIQGSYGETFSTVVPFTVQAGSTATDIETDLTEGTNDHYIGRTVVFVTGALAHQASDVTDYDGVGKKLVVTALTEAPSNGDRAIIV